MKHVWSKTLAAGVLIAAFATLSAVALAQNSKTPDATFTFSGKSAGVGVGFTWGDGVLNYKGKEYAFRLKGINVADVGGTEFKGKGNVYNLQKVVDFAGNYAAASASAALGEAGQGETNMQNDRGVVIRMTSEAKGAQLKLAVEGVTIELQAPAQ